MQRIRFNRAIPTKRKPKKGNIYRGFNISSTSIRTSSRATHTFPYCMCLSVLCNPDVYRPTLIPAFIISFCALENYFFLHFSENLNIFSLLKIQEKQNETSSRYLLITKHSKLKSKCFWQQQHTLRLMKRMTNVPTDVVFTGHGLHLSRKVSVGSSWLHCASSLSLSLTPSFFLSPGAVNVIKQNPAQKWFQMVPITFDQPWNKKSVQNLLFLEFHTLRHCPF